MYPVPNRPPDNKFPADDRGLELTERQRRAVAVTSTQIADEVRVDTALLAGREIDSAGIGSVLRTAAVHLDVRQPWRRRLAQAFDDLAADVAAGGTDLHRGTDGAAHCRRHRGRPAPRRTTSTISCATSRPIPMTSTGSVHWSSCSRTTTS